MQHVVQYIFGFIFFLVTTFFSFYIPGSVLISLLKLKRSFSTVGISFLVGVALFLLIAYATAYLQIPRFTEIILFLFSICWLYFFVRSIGTIRFHLFTFDKVTALLVLVGTLAFASLMVFSGLQTQNGLQFFATNSTDGIRHVAYITDQVHHFPPQEPSVAGEPLQGFHYFYDFLLSRFALFYSFPVMDLYFRYFPLFISFFYGCSFVLFLKTMQCNKIAQRLILFLVYFSRSSILLLFLLNHTVSLTDDAIVQPLGLIINPFIVLSLGILFCGFSLMPLLKQSWKYGILIGLLFGVLSEMKVYIGIIAISCLIVYAGYLFIRFHKKYLAPILVTVTLTGLITVITYFPNNFGAGGLVFAPLLFFQHYMQTDLFTPLHWATRLVVYQQRQNISGEVFLYILAICIFVLLNFGIRLVILIKTRLLFSSSFWKVDMHIILFCALFTSLIIPSLFIQSISVFDTIQFFWIALVLLSIPTGIALAEIYKKIHSQSLRFVLVVGIIAISIPSVSVTIYKYTLSSSRIIIPTQDEKTLQEIATVVPETSFIVLPPPSPKTSYTYPLPQDTPFIASLTGRQVYYEEGWLPTPDETQYQIREMQMEQLQTALIGCFPLDISSLVKKIGSPYIITIGSYPCLSSTFSVEKEIAANSGLIHFYQISLQ